MLQANIRRLHRYHQRREEVHRISVVRYLNYHYQRSPLNRRSRRSRVTDLVECIRVLEHAVDILAFPGRYPLPSETPSRPWEIVGPIPDELSTFPFSHA